jgi:putative SOS response-associated peptidase YedK
MANALVASVHPKAMPMILAEDEQEQWLSGTFAEVCALSDAYPMLRCGSCLNHGLPERRPQR